MNNYELHSRAHELAASHSGYNLARRLLALEEELQEARREFGQSHHSGKEVTTSDIRKAFEQIALDMGLPVTRNGNDAVFAEYRDQYRDDRTQAAWSVFKRGPWQSQQAQAKSVRIQQYPEWPTVGFDYLVRFDGVWQFQTYRFDQGDDGIGGGEYFWDRDDVDEGRLFDPHNDAWINPSKIGAMPAPAAVPERPLGAVHNGRVFIERIEHTYQFSDNGHPLGNCSDWSELIRCFEVLVDYVLTTPAPADPK